MKRILYNTQLTKSCRALVYCLHMFEIRLSPFQGFKVQNTFKTCVFAETGSVWALRKIQLRDSKSAFWLILTLNIRQNLWFPGIWDQTLTLKINVNHCESIFVGEWVHKCSKVHVSRVFAWPSIHFLLKTGKFDELAYSTMASP